MSRTAHLPANTNELLLKLYQLSHEMPIAQFQDAALTLLKQIIPFDSSMWGTATATKGGIEIHTIHLHEASMEMIEEYQALKHYDTAAASVVDKANVTASFNVDTWVGGKHEREFRDYLARYEHENVFIAADTNAGTSFVHWTSLFRADKEAHCTEDERLLLSQLAPHIRQSLAMNRVTHLQRMEVADKLLSPYGSAIADVRGVVYYADPQFDALARLEWPDWKGSALPSRLLEPMLLGQHSLLGSTIAVRWHTEHSLLFLKARPCCRADRLSPREQVVAQLVAQGQTYKQIAQSQGRSPSTIRNQIQLVYDKLEVSSIASLIRELQFAA